MLEGANWGKESKWKPGKKTCGERRRESRERERGEERRREGRRRRIRRGRRKGIWNLGQTPRVEGEKEERRLTEGEYHKS